MTIYVDVTDTCNDDARNHGQVALLKKLLASIRKTQNLTGFDFLRPTPFIKKGLGRSFRLIAYRVPVEHDELILFLRVLARGSNDYEYFLSHWRQRTNAVARRFQPYDNDKVQQILSKLKQVSSPQVLRQPDQKEQGWLYEVFQPETSSDELFVLETEDWVKRMKAKESLPYLGFVPSSTQKDDRYRPAPGLRL